MSKSKQEGKKNCDSEGSHDVLTIRRVTVKRVIEHLWTWRGALCFSSLSKSEEKLHFSQITTSLSWKRDHSNKKSSQFLRFYITVMVSSHHVPCYYELLNRLLQITNKQKNKQPGTNREHFKVSQWEIRPVCSTRQVFPGFSAGNPKSYFWSVQKKYIKISQI